MKRGILFCLGTVVVLCKSVCLNQKTFERRNKMESQTNGITRGIAILLIIALLLVGKKLLGTDHSKMSLPIPHTYSSNYIMPK